MHVPSKAMLCGWITVSSVRCKFCASNLWPGFPIQQAIHLCKSALAVVQCQESDLRSFIFPKTGGLFIFSELLWKLQVKLS